MSTGVGAMMGALGGGVLGMGVIITLHDQFSRQAQSVQSSMNKLGIASVALNDSINQSLGQVGAGVMAMGLGLAGLLPIVRSISVAGEFEQMEIAFEVMLGSVEKATALLKDLKKFAIQTPFDLQEVQKLSVQLIAYGVEGEHVIETMKALGDVAAGVGKDKLGRVVLAYGQILTKGRLMAQEVRQLNEQGVPIIQAMSDMYGMSRGDFTDAMESGNLVVPFEKVKEAFKEMTSEGGRFNDLMIRQMVTFKGMASNITDRIYQIQIAVGQAFLPMMFKLVTVFSSFLQSVQDFFESKIGQHVARIAAAFSLLITAMGLFMVVSGGVRLATVTMINTFSAMPAVFARLTAALTRGVIPGLMAVQAQMWATALSSMAATWYIWLPIAAFAALVMVIYRAKEAFASFDGNAKGLSSIARNLARIGGMIQFFSEAIRTLNTVSGESVISDSTMQKLDALGITDKTLTLWSHLGRIVGFVKAMMFGFYITWIENSHAINDVLSEVKNVLWEMLKAFGLIDPNTSSFNQWVDIGIALGKALAYATVGIIVLGAYGVLIAAKLIKAFTDVFNVIMWVPIMIFKVLKSLATLNGPELADIGKSIGNKIVQGILMAFADIVPLGSAAMSLFNYFDRKKKPNSSTAERLSEVGLDPNAEPSFIPFPDQYGLNNIMQQMNNLNNPALATGMAAQDQIIQLVLDGKVLDQYIQKVIVQQDNRR